MFLFGGLLAASAQESHSQKTLLTNRRAYAAGSAQSNETKARLMLLPPEQFPSRGSLQERASFLFPYVIVAAQANGVDPRVLWAICYKETRFQPSLCSPKGACGLTQLMSATAARFGVNNRLDFRQALDGGAKYIRYLTQLFRGNLVHILGGYNAGEGAVLAYLRGGSYVGGSGRRYTVTANTPGFGTGIPQNAETIDYVKEGVTIFNNVTQARMFESYLLAPSGAVQMVAYTPRRAPQSSAQNTPASSNENKEADSHVPTNSFYFGRDTSENSSGAGEADKKNESESESVTQSFRYP